MKKVVTFGEVMMRLTPSGDDPRWDSLIKPDLLIDKNYGAHKLDPVITNSLTAFGFVGESSYIFINRTIQVNKRTSAWGGPSRTFLSALKPFGS